MDNQETETKELTEEQSKTRKRKLLTDPDGLWTRCKMCKEAGNLERLIRHQLPVKNLVGVELYGGFEYVYFCGESCLELFG